MKRSFSVRKIDNLGRIVIPMDFRKALEIKDWDELSMRLEDDHIVIAKAREACTFCGSELALSPFQNKFICSDCLAKLKTEL